MLTTPSIDSVLEELESLAPLLSAEVGGRAATTPQARLYKEALQTTRVLLDKLRVVRAYCTSPTPRRACPTCDGD